MEHKFLKNYKNFYIIQMKISPFTLHAKGRNAKQHLKYSCDTLHFVKVTFRRVSEIKKNARD